MKGKYNHTHWFQRNLLCAIFMPVDMKHQWRTSNTYPPLLLMQECRNLVLVSVLTFVNVFAYLYITLCRLLYMPRTLNYALIFIMTVTTTVRKKSVVLLMCFRRYWRWWRPTRARSMKAQYYRRWGHATTSTWPARTWSTRPRPRPPSRRCSMSSSVAWSSRLWVL